MAFSASWVWEEEQGEEQDLIVRLNQIPLSQRSDEPEQEEERAA